MIGGRRAAADGAALQEVVDPASGEAIAQVPLSGAPVVDRAARAAAEAADGWADVPVMERARLMFRLQALLERDFEELSEIVVRENGKSLDEARGEVRRGIDVVEFAAGMPTLMMGGALEQVSRGVDTELFHHPLGAVAAITPFNFPAMVPLWTSPIAIAAGNSYILKPSPRTPMSAMRLAELFEEAGTPAGVFNVVHGGRGGGECDLRSRAHPCGLVRRLGSCREARSTLARPPPASACKRWPARRTTSWSCPTPIWTQPCRACSPPPSPMPGSGASPVLSASPSERSRTSCRSGSPGWHGRRGSARASIRRARSHP